VKLAGGPANSSRFPEGMNPADPPVSEIGRQGRVVTTVCVACGVLGDRLLSSTAGGTGGGQTVGGAVHGKTYAPVASAETDETGHVRARAARRPRGRERKATPRWTGHMAARPPEHAGLRGKGRQAGTVAPSPAAFLPGLSGPHDHMAGPCVLTPFHAVLSVWLISTQLAPTERDFAREDVDDGRGTR
jgi:hypothetical protein